MPTQPLVSVVTPSYNQARFLRQTIESVLGQDYPHLEYLVLDGGSTDGSVGVIREYQDQLAYWVSEPDEGQADAINRGWQRARGEILAWLNSDDTYEPGAISAVVDAFRRHPGTDVISGDCRVIDQDGGFVRFLPSAGFDLHATLSGNSLPQPGVFCRRSAVEGVGWLDARLNFVFDWALWLKLGLQGAIFCHLPQVVASFRVWGQSKTSAGAVGTSLSGGIPFAAERLSLLSDLVESARLSGEPGLPESVRDAWLSGMLEMALLHQLEGDGAQVAAYLCQFAGSIPRSFHTLPYLQALAAHLAYLEGDANRAIDTLLDGFAVARDQEGALLPKNRWRRQLRAETALVRAWSATHRRDHVDAAWHFLKAILFDPSLLLQRRVVSPAVRSLCRIPMSGPAGLQSPFMSRR